MSELKPCPFCGGEGVVGCAYGSVYGISDDWFIECAHCGTTNISPTRGHATEAEAIEAWNTRVYRPCCPQPCTPSCWYEGVE